MSNERNEKDRTEKGETKSEQSKTNTVDLVKRRVTYTRADEMTGANQHRFWAVE